MDILAPRGTPVLSADDGVVLRLRGRLAGRCANVVWSLDFKGQFRTADGRQILALTVRDVASCYVLDVRHVPKPSEAHVAGVMRTLFGRYGLPKALRTDNGSPFGAPGPRGWTSLSAGWVKLGIRMEYGRPRCPQDRKPQPRPGRPRTGQSIARGVSCSKEHSPRTLRNAPSVAGA